MFNRENVTQTVMNFSPMQPTTDSEVGDQRGELSSEDVVKEVMMSFSHFPVGDEIDNDDLRDLLLY